MKGNCSKHGEVEFTRPGVNGSSYCPTCITEWLDSSPLRAGIAEAVSPFSMGAVVSGRTDSSGPSYASSSPEAVEAVKRCKTCSGTGIVFFEGAQRLTPDEEGITSCCVVERCDKCCRYASDEDAMRASRRAVWNQHIADFGAATIREAEDARVIDTVTDELVKHLDEKKPHRPLVELEEELVRAYKAVSEKVRHKKTGEFYLLAGVAIDERTQKVIVLYRPKNVETRVVFSRPLEEFLERFDRCDR